MDYLLTMAISIVLQAVKHSFKNPEKAAELKRALLKVRDAISLLYPEESEPLPPLS